MLRACLPWGLRDTARCNAEDGGDDPCLILIRSGYGRMCVSSCGPLRTALWTDASTSLVVACDELKLSGGGSGNGEGHLAANPRSNASIHKPPGDDVMALSLRSIFASSAFPVRPVLYCACLLLQFFAENLLKGRSNQTLGLNLSFARTHPGILYTSLSKKLWQ